MTQEENQKFLDWLEKAKWVLPENWSIAKCREFFEKNILKKEQE